MTIAELFSEFVYNQIPISVIAGLTDTQIKEVYGRKRDEKGKLIRKKPIDSDSMDARIEPVGFKAMYYQVKQNQGLSPEQVERAWKKYCILNPGLESYSNHQIQVLDMLKNEYVPPEISDEDLDRLLAEQEQKDWDHAYEQ